MIGRYRGSCIPTLDDKEGQWVSYDAHYKRMESLMKAVAVAIYKAQLNQVLTPVDLDQLEDAFYSWIDEMGGGPDNFLTKVRGLIDERYEKEHA